MRELVRFLIVAPFYAAALLVAGLMFLAMSPVVVWWIVRDTLAGYPPKGPRG